jgi:GMP synthase (glutamine-hydrolysing)
VRVLSVVHHDNARAGVFGDAGGELVDWMVPDGDPPPPLPGFDALMVFGGSMHADQEAAHPWLRVEKALIGEAIESGMPVLGVCLGSQLVAEVAGAKPHKAAEAELGWREIEITSEGAADPVIGPLAPSALVFQWHAYESPLPPDAVELARSPLCLQAFRLRDRPVWGVQFHAEVTEPDLFGWLAEFGEDPDAVATGIDPDAIRSESRERLPAQHELGRGLAARFLDQARAVRAAAA